MIAILISTSGSVVKRYLADFPRKDVVVIWDRINDFIPGVINIHTSFALSDKVLFENKVLSICNHYNVKVAISFLTRLVSKLCDQDLNFPIVNFHPSILPAHKGLLAVKEQSISLPGSLTFGASVHYVDSGVDTGQVILQTKEKAFLTDRTELQRRIFPHQFLQFYLLLRNLDVIKDARTNDTDEWQILPNLDSIEIKSKIANFDIYTIDKTFFDWQAI